MSFLPGIFVDGSVVMTISFQDGFVFVLFVLCFAKLVQEKKLERHCRSATTCNALYVTLFGKMIAR